MAWMLLPPPLPENVTCTHNVNYSNLANIKFRAVVCDGARNYAEVEEVAWIEQNVSYRGPYGELCRCGEGTYFFMEFTGWDWLDAGDVLGDRRDEIVVARDDDQQIYIYDDGGGLLGNFSVPYTPRDRMVVGDVVGDSGEEILIVCDDDGQVYIHNGSGTQITHFYVGFTEYDGFAVGDILGDEGNEILIAKEDDHRIHVYDEFGAEIRELDLPDTYSGSRYTHENSRHDGFAVGDVLNDEKKEIVIGLEGEDEVFIYDSDMNLLTTIPEVRFSPNDGFTVGDVSGDGKEEILIGEDGSWLVHVYTPGFGLQKTHYITFTKYDGFAAGDVDGDGKDEILIAIDEDNRVYIEKEPSIPRKITLPSIVLGEFTLTVVSNATPLTFTPRDMLFRGHIFEGILNLTPTEEPEKPDLTITGLAVYPQGPRIYQPATVKVEVHNNGTVNSTGDINLTLYWGCHPITERISPLGAGEKTEITFPNALIFLEAERNEIIAMVDSGFEVAESNETNNNYSIVVYSELPGVEGVSTGLDFGDEPEDPISCLENPLMGIGRNKTPGGDFYRDENGSLINDPDNETIWLPGQGDTNSCGTTSLAYVLRYLLNDDTYTHGIIDDEIRDTSVDGGRGMFSDPLSLVDYARDKGLNAEIYNNGNFEEVKEFTDRGIPVMLAITPDASGDVTASHWIVVVSYCEREKEYPPGATERVIAIYNPWGYQYEIREDRLGMYWGAMDLWGNPLWNKLFIAISSDQPLPEGDTDGIENELATAQAISQIFNGWDDIGDGGRSLIEGDIAEGLGEIVEGLGTAVAGVVDVLVGGIVGEILLGWWGYADDVPFVGGFLEAGEEFLGGILSTSGELIESLSEDLGDLIENWYNPLEWLEFIGDVIVSIGRAILGMLEAVWDLIVDVFKAIGRFFVELWDLLKDFVCWLFGAGCPEMHCKTKHIVSIDPCGETVIYMNGFVREGALGYIHTRNESGLNPLYLYMETDFGTENKHYYLSTDPAAYIGTENLTRISLLGYVNSTCGCTNCCVDLTNIANERGLNLTSTSIGFLPRYRERNTEKLWLFRDDATEGYVVSRDPCAGTRTFSSQAMEDHTRDGFLGYINLNQVPGTTRVYRYWNPDTEEFFLSLDPNESAGDYINTGFIGYAYLENITGTTPLYDFKGVSSKELVNVTTLCVPREEYRYRKTLIGYIHEEKDNACVAELWKYCRRDIWYA